MCACNKFQSCTICTAKHDDGYAPGNFSSLTWSSNKEFNNKWPDYLTGSSATNDLSTEQRVQQQMTWLSNREFSNKWPDYRTGSSATLKHLLAVLVHNACAHFRSIPVPGTVGATLETLWHQLMKRCWCAGCNRDQNILYPSRQTTLAHKARCFESWLTAVCGQYCHPWP